MPVMDWIEKMVARQGTSIEQTIHLEHQRQAAAQVTVGNIITSMRLLSTLDWNDFFEKVSLIEPLLGKDPAGVYSRMEFASRDRYRHVIERIGKRTRASELKIAEAAIDLATQADENSRPQRHVGYYLIDAGLSRLESSFSYQPPPTERLRRFLLRHSTGTYLGTLTMMTLLIMTPLLYFMNRYGVGWPLLFITALLAVIPASDLAVTVLNWDLTHFFPPRLLPRMDTVDGIPEDAATFVVVPTIFLHESQVHELVERLQVHYLANQVDHVYFALLSDFPDATSEETPTDSPLLAIAQSGIDALNLRHGSERFHLFHRRRQWNEGESKWMGWERKRGKLEEFNRLLRGARDTSFLVRTAADELLRSIRYVITLDSDTQLPRDVARKLVGAAIHPLNQPSIDAATNRVTYGYGILQPRVSISLASASRSKLVQIFSGYTGIDPYTTAVSDVYQDFFGEGSFTGKGLYNVDAFQRTLDNRVPPNSLLSHDLFESLFARAALTTDIELLDDYPSSYEAYAKRAHRWTRGDWQILRWLFPTVPDGERRRVRNVLPLMARWKILDNLRRSLVAPSLFLWLLASCALFPGSTLLWCLFVFLVIAFPVYLHVTTGLLMHPRGIPWTSHFWSLWGDFRTNTAQIALSFVFLAHQTWSMCDAIVRALYRQLISHRKLLEWVSAAEAEKSVRNDAASYVRFMIPALVLTLIALALTMNFKPAGLPVMGTLVVVWMLSPFIAYVVSKPRATIRKILNAADFSFVRLIARRTWRFFETFVGAEDNWLPPDNYQEDPAPVVAHRTSPTNIGLLLLSTCSARDLGYVGTLELVEREELTFSTLAQLARMHGHFFNWYDTRTLEPLLPQYISTVDSGNLAGHLLAVKQACIEFPENSLFDARVIEGLRDTIDAVASEASTLGSFRQRTEVVTVRQLQDEIAACRSLLQVELGHSLSSWIVLFDSLARRASEIEDIVNALAHEHGEVSFKELRWWVGALNHQVASQLRDVEGVTSWARLLSLIEQDADESWAPIVQILQEVPALADVPQLCDRALVQLAAMQNDESPTLGQTAARLTKALEQSAGAASDVLSRLSRLARRCDQIIEEMDFSFLFDVERKLFPIGYNVTASRVDDSYYDLLASEARLASFVGIAKGDVPQQHWFRMGRALTKVDGGRALISWTGTMFEYLMPLLVMRNYHATLLSETYRT
jgi:cyclic beta-1,2-glucan synthetase